MRFIFVLLLFSALPAAAEIRLPLGDGEALTYKVSWAVVVGAGEIKILGQTDAAGPVSRLRITTTTATRGFARLLLPFNARAESVFDRESGRLLALTEFSKQRNKVAEHSVTFDYAGAQALYAVPGSDEKPRPLRLPAGEPLDLITSLVQTRSWDLKPGDTRDALVLFDDEFYELTIHAARTEEVETPLGIFQTLVLEPRMDKTAPKGMFRKGSSVRVWISQNDEHHLPVKFEVEFKIGTGVATLIGYKPPSASPAAGGGRAATSRESGPRANQTEAGQAADATAAMPDAKNSRP